MVDEEVEQIDLAVGKGNLGQRASYANQADKQYPFNQGDKRQADHSQVQQQGITLRPVTPLPQRFMEQILLYTQPLFTNEEELKEYLRKEAAKRIAVNLGAQSQEQASDCTEMYLVDMVDAIYEADDDFYWTKNK